MDQEKIAILVDSGTDVPPDFQTAHHIFVAPLKILYKDKEYNDRVDITPQDVYNRLEEEIPRTSLPDAETVTALFNQMVSEGYKQVLIITISSGLSGTHNMLRLLAQEYKKLPCHMVDTKNIGIGAGMQAMLAARLIKKGLGVQEILNKLETSIQNTKLYFCLDTLEYLAKGGRIGKVSAILGSILHLKPIIGCNAEGVYETVAKVRGRAQAIEKTISMIVTQAGQYANFIIAVAHGSAKEEAKHVLSELKRRLPQCDQFLQSDVSPALSVHTGPGLVGVALQGLS